MMQPGDATSAALDTVEVGLVQINSMLNWTRQRFAGRIARTLTVQPKQAEHEDEATGWMSVPYSVGLLQAYTQRHAPRPERYRFRPLIYQRVRVEQGARSLLGVDVAGFSTYIWNARLSLAMAARLKELQPEVLVVFGGPQVPDHAEAFLRAHPFIDLVCHGEGEAVFLQILERCLTRDWSGIPSISYLDPDGEFISHPRAPRMPDLDAIPSPYLEGVFEPLIQANPQEQWLMLWETNRGCPFSCSFCDWGSAVASKVYQFPIERLQRELDWVAAHRVEAIFTCDSNFGMLPRDLDLAQYAAAVKERTGYPHALSVQNTKNATERSYAVQTTLARAGLNAGVVLALQSVDPHTLASIKRDNISTESFEELQRRYTRDHVPTYTDLILALPGETYESYVNGVNHIIDHGQHRRLSFYNCSILPNAEMGDPAYQRQHAIRFVPQRMLSAHQAITTVSDEEVPEYIDTVIETSAMPRADWLKAKTFWWMTEFLYYDRVCQLPFAILRHHYGVSYRDLIEAVLHADPTAFPVCGRIQQLFREKAQAIQAGDIEWIPSPEWLGILWPADQYALLSVVTRGEFDAFYGEIHAITAGLLRDRGIEPEPGLLDALFAFGRCLFRLPFQEKDLSAELPYNFWECYESILESHPIPLRRHTSLYTIHRQGASFATRDVWFEHIVFCTNQKTPYMYEVTAAERESARLMREMLSAAR